MLALPLETILAILLLVLEVAADQQLEQVHQLVTRKKKHRVIKHTNHKCYDENMQQIPCPKDPNAAKIVGIVLGSVFGALILGGSIYWFIKRRRNQRLSKSFASDKEAGVKTSQRGYQQLHDHVPPSEST